jgi:hypothetical protein
VRGEPIAVAVAYSFGLEPFAEPYPSRYRVPRWPDLTSPLVTSAGAPALVAAGNPRRRVTSAPPPGCGREYPRPLLSCY